MKMGRDEDLGSSRQPWNSDTGERVRNLRRTVLHWKHKGGKPFADVEFLIQSVKRMNHPSSAQPNGTAP